MGLAHRIIPLLLMHNGHLVKGKQFNSARIVGNAFQAAEIYQSRGVDEMIVIDVAATIRGSEPNIYDIRRLTDKCFMPITAGGGIKTIDHVRDLLANGADKVLIGSAAIDDPSLVLKCARKFGSQAITVAVDVRRYGSTSFITSRCGSSEHTCDPVEFAKDMERRGAGELVVTCINNEGMMLGYNIKLIKDIAKAVDIPVIASGGAGEYEHMHRALKAGASAVAAGSLFQFTDCTPKGAAEYLAKKGWEVRL